MLATLTATLVFCTVELEADGTYFAVCQGRRELMESAILAQVKGLCEVYEYGVFESCPSFVVVCDP